MWWTVRNALPTKKALAFHIQIVAFAKWKRSHLIICFLGVCGQGLACFIHKSYPNFTKKNLEAHLIFNLGKLFIDPVYLRSLVLCITRMNKMISQANELMVVWNDQVQNYKWSSSRFQVELFIINAELVVPRWQTSSNLESDSWLWSLIRWFDSIGQ